MSNREAAAASERPLELEYRMYTPAEVRTLILADRAASAPQAVRMTSAQLSAIEAITLKLLRIQVGGCNCGTKTPNIEHHKVACHYRLAVEAGELLQAALREDGT